MKRRTASMPSPLLSAVGSALIAVGVITDFWPVTVAGILVNSVYAVRFFRFRRSA